jgi:serine phosphatase RsbU (regulator of sigma subunit)
MYKLSMQKFTLKALHFTLFKALFIAFLTIIPLFTSFAQSNATQKTFKVGYYEDKPLCFKDTDGAPKGIYMDILDYIALENGWQIKFVFEPSFHKNLEALKKGEIDILLSIGFSDERAKIYDFNKETILQNWGEIFVHKDSVLNSILALENKKIGVVRGNIYYEGSHGLKNTAKQFHLPMNFIEVDSYQEVLDLIDKEQIDAGLISKLYGDMHKEEHQIQGTPIVFHPIDLRFAFTKNKPHNQQLIQSIDTEMHKLIRDESSIYHQSLARWLNLSTHSANYQWLLYSLSVAGVVAILFVVLSFLLRRQVQRKTKELVRKNAEIQGLNESLEQKVKDRTAEVVLQKEQLEHINKQMRDSITYARNIQEAVMPEEAKIAKHIPQYFIFSLPRDIVSGDFHWFYHREKDNKNFLAVADCTGHGVPGAFMSMLGKSSLDYIVHERPAKTAADVLQELQSDIYRALGTNARDGMDIALCGFDLINKQVEFAGAMNSLYLVRNGKCEVIKGNKFPIGGDVKYYKIERSFHNHTLQLETNDILYMTSDGFIDQFGGPDTRRFGTRRFNEFLERIVDLPLNQQREALHTEHKNWKLKNKQLDDILVIGVKI